MSTMDDLFEGGLDQKLNFKDNSKSFTGLYAFDADKIKDPNKGWKSVLRLLPNLSQEGKLGELMVPRVINQVRITDQKYSDLNGSYDSLDNFGQKRDCKLSKLYWTLQDSKNALMVERAQGLKKYTNYYSYALVLEDEQQPELVGKIVIFRYGSTIMNKIQSEKQGDITGESCNVFNLDNGKDLVYMVRMKDKQPDYSNCSFRPNPSPISIFDKEKETFKKVPLDENGKIPAKFREIIKNFLLDREHEIDTYAPRELSEEQKEKIERVIEYMTTGKVSSMGTEYGTSDPLSSSSENSISSDDFGLDFDEEPATATSSSDDTDLFDDDEWGL